MLNYSNSNIRSNPPHNLSVSETAAFIGISPRKTREEIAKGLLRTVRLGRRVIVRLEDIKDYLSEHVQ